MHVSRGRMAGHESIRQGETFTGEVWADPVVTGLDAVTINHVFFAPRSRTFWHRHSSGQVLQIANGTGWVVSRTYGVVHVQAGDVVWIEPDDVHWHGADQHTYLLHTAVSLAETEWLAEVTDDEYVTALASQDAALR